MRAAVIWCAAMATAILACVLMVIAPLAAIAVVVLGSFAVAGFARTRSTRPVRIAPVIPITSARSSRV